MAYYHNNKDGTRSRIASNQTFQDTPTEMLVTREEFENAVKPREYDVVVAASDSSDEDKQLADLVCDGVNDEVEIQQAVNFNIGKTLQCKVKLCKGTYYIDKFEKKTISSGSTTNVQYAIMIDTYYKDYIHQPYRVELYGSGHTQTKAEQSDTKLIVTDTAISTVDDTMDNVVFGLSRAGSQKMGYIGQMRTLLIDNIYMYTNGTNHRVIAIDAVNSEQTEITNCSLSAVRMYTDIRLDTAGFNGSIGIRCGKGSNAGIGNKIKSTRIVGFNEGIALVGEHFIIEDCVEHSCWTGFTIGNYDVVGSLEHPNVFIGNSVEQCYQFCILTRAGATETSEIADNQGRGARQSIYYIGGSTEPYWRDSNGTIHTMLGINEVINGAYAGRVETDWDKYSGFRRVGCKRLTLRNLQLPNQGSSADRPPSVIFGYGGVYFDWTLHKPLYAFGSNWYDSDGNIVT